MAKKDRKVVAASPEMLPEGFQPDTLPKKKRQVRTYTDADIEEFAADLEAWARRSDSFHFSEWLSNHGINWMTASRFKERSEYFTETWNTAKTRLEWKLVANARGEHLARNLFLLKTGHGYRENSLEVVADSMERITLSYTDFLKQHATK